MKTLRDELRERYPNKTGRAAAVVLFCIECMGGDRGEARRCQTRDCFLWPYGPAAKAEARKSADAEDEADFEEEAK